MIRSLVFVTESKNDWMYIQSTIKALYDISEIRLDNVSMNGKNNYNKNSIIYKIKEVVKGIKGEYKIIYCFDTDEIEKEQSSRQYLKDIAKYCKDNDFELIWFCRTIEEVFIGNKISGNIKTENAIKFQRTINNVDFTKIRLDSNDKKFKNSNLLIIVDKYLNRN